MKYSIVHITEILRGTLLGQAEDSGIDHLLTDSRKLIFPQSSLFFALQGGRRDGHQFLRELHERGVRNFVISLRDHAQGLEDSNIILVRDTLHALQDLAAFHRMQFELPVIGITGSNGKTIVKEWINQLLEDQKNIVRSPRSYNSQIGVPLSVWQIHPSNDLGIFEAGISRPGEMERLEQVIRPTIGIITNIGEAHSEGFSGIGEKISEKLHLFRRSGTLIFCRDHEALKEAIDALASNRQGSMQEFPLTLISWGYSEEAEIRIIRMEKEAGNTGLQLRYRSEIFTVLIPFADAASVENAMHCVALLLHLEIPVATIQTKLLRLVPVGMRLELKEGINGCVVINDSYSTDINSLKIALDFLHLQRQPARRTAILSDILQSGREDRGLYGEVAKLLREKGIHRLFAVGERISACREEMEKHFQGTMHFFPGTDQLIKNFHPTEFRDEIILLKGARVFGFERIDQQLVRQVHQTVLEISLDHMAHNLKQYQQLLRPATRLMVMVKAFAYGLGSYEIANFLQFHKVDYLGVAYADEGVELRQSGIHLPVMVMNADEAGFGALVQYGLEPVVYSFRLLESIDQFCKKEGLSDFPVHIEIETGMNRLGFSTNDIGELAARLKNTSFKVQSVFSHFAASEEPQQDAFSSLQGERFIQSVKVLEAAIPYPFLKHIANSAAIIRHPQWQLDMVRLGIGLYGVDSAASGRLDLREVATLKSTIAQIREIGKDETVGYNRKGVAGQRTRMATIRIGYADGYPRSLGNGNGKMWLKGRPVPTLGNICMDMTMVDISGVPDVGEGDEILVFGGEIPIARLAEWAGTIPYEIITGLSARVKRIYFEE